MNRMNTAACPHVKPRLDGALVGPCDECAPPELLERRTIAVTYNGGGEMNSRQAFHDRTIGEALREHKRHHPADAEPVGTRWV